MIHLDRVENRKLLLPRRDPYWQRVAPGRFLGFRKMSRGAFGTWLARRYNGEGYDQIALGELGLPENERFDAARREAEKWFGQLGEGGHAGREAADSEFRPLIRTLSLVPLRPGDVAQLKVRDFNARRGTLQVPTGKEGGREIALSSTAITHLKGCAKGKLPDALLIARAGGQAWTKGAWKRAWD